MIATFLSSLNWTIQFEPLLHWGIAAGIGLLGFLLILASLWFRRAKIFWRALACLLMACAVMNPLISLEERTPLPTITLLIEDISPSQSVTGRTKQTTQAADALTQKLRQLDQSETYRFTLDAKGGSGTQLFAFLDEKINQFAPNQLGGVVVISDGRIHDNPDNIAPSWGRDIPFHLFLTGKEEDTDRRITITKAPRFMLINEPQNAEVTIQDEGPTPEGASVPVTILRDGEPYLQVTAKAGATLTFPLKVDHAGDTLFEVIADALPGEVSTLNNRLVIKVEGIRETLRVLLVSGEPHAGERVWRNLLKSDTSVDMVHFTILRPPNKQDGTPINELSLIAFPTRELFSEKINDFDLIVLDRYQRRGVLPRLYFRNIVNYIKDGGGLLIASGPEYAQSQSLWQSPLSDVLPAEPSGAMIEEAYKPVVSELGLRHPVTRNLQDDQQSNMSASSLSIPSLAAPSWGPWYRLIQTSQIVGQTILNANNNAPLLVLNRIEKGRVAMLLSDHIWLWARDHQGGGPHNALLKNIAHWLMQEPELEEERLFTKKDGRQIIVLRQTLSETLPPLAITAPDGQTNMVTMAPTKPGLYEATLDANQDGLWQFSQGDLSTLAHMGPVNTLEMQDLLASKEPLMPVLEQAKASFHRLSTRDMTEFQPVLVSSSGPFSGNGWIGFKSSTASELNSVKQRSLFAGFLGLALLAGFLSIVWWREGR
jgi:hypothetical protein